MQRPLRRSGSFKVTDFGTNRKLIYDFLLMFNTNLPPTCTVFKLWLIIGHLFASESGVPHSRGCDPLLRVHLGTTTASALQPFYVLKLFHFRKNRQSHDFNKKGHNFDTTSSFARAL